MKSLSTNPSTGPLPQKIEALLEEIPLVEASDYPKWRRHLQGEGYSGTEIAIALTQWELRQQALKKFGEIAQKMLFTRAGLEQASQLEVANYHAQIFHAAGLETVADLGCGLGADALAFARNKLAVEGVEIDPETAAYAAFNLKSFPCAKVFLGSAQEYYHSKKPPVIFADPARRDQRGRVFNPHRWSPSLPEIISWQEHCKFIGVKIAPGIKYEDLPPNFHARWVAISENLVEATLWSKSLMPPGRSAMIITADGNQLTLAIPKANDPTEKADSVHTAQLGQYLFEANPALLRAGGLHYLAENLDAGLISPGISYLTGNVLPPPRLEPWLRSYHILEVLPLRLKVIAQALKVLGASRIDIKKRGWDGDPADFRKKLLRALPKAEDKPHTVTLILSRIAGKHRCLLVSPLNRQC